MKINYYFKNLENLILMMNTTTFQTFKMSKLFIYITEFLLNQIKIKSKCPHQSLILQNIWEKNQV